MGGREEMNTRLFLRALFDAAVASADPQNVVPLHLPEPRPRGRTVVIGAGKASAAMANAFEKAWAAPLSGLVVARYGHAVPCQHIEIVEAAHPVPDAAGEQATRRMLALVQDLGAEDLVVGLFSGGGSALLTAPAPGLTLADKQAVTQALLSCGASIEEINTVRKHLSEIKGGQLAAAAWPARVESLLISDVPGDDPSVIASGPTLPDPTSVADAREVLARYAIQSPEMLQETPKPGDPRLARSHARLIATPQRALQAAAEVARRAGYTPLILSDAIEGETREVARVLAAIAMQVRRYGQPAVAPCVLLSGGETQVTVRGKGRGGRNVEFLLSLALALRGLPDVWALSADTDGIDGSEEIAGAIVTPDTLSRAQAQGLSARDYLASNDAHSFFASLKDQVITGPTLTNVNDFRAIVINPLTHALS